MGVFVVLLGGGVVAEVVIGGLPTSSGFTAPTSSGVGGANGMFSVAGVGIGISTALAEERPAREGGGETSFGISALLEPGRKVSSACFRSAKPRYKRL